MPRKPDNYLDFLAAIFPAPVKVKRFFMCLCLVYLAWELFWARRVGYPCIKWHTHLMLYLYLALAGILLFQFLNKGIAPARRGNCFLLFVSVVCALFLAESFFIISGLNKTYIERAAGYYISPYVSQDKNYYHVWQGAKEHWLTTPEFSFWRPTNSLGFADKEWSRTKRLKERRVLALGDSFTEGDGAPNDSSFVKLLGEDLEAIDSDYYMMNGGVCGSDPFNNYINLRDLLLVYKPDIIIQSLGSGDMNSDILIRGGMERFQMDGTVKYQKAPWWEPVYAISYISRIFFKLADYNDLLQKENLVQTQTGRINKSVEQLFNQYSELCEQHGIRLFVVLHPEKREIEGNNYNYDFSSLLQHLAANNQIHVIDLLPLYRTYIARNHTSAGNYFWKHDGHHNASGYKMMAETIFQNINPLLSDSLTARNN